MYFICVFLSDLDLPRENEDCCQWARDAMATQFTLTCDKMTFALFKDNSAHIDQKCITDAFHCCRGLNDVLGKDNYYLKKCTRPFLYLKCDCCKGNQDSTQKNRIAIGLIESINWSLDHRYISYPQNMKYFI